MHGGENTLTLRGATDEVVLVGVPFDYASVADLKLRLAEALRDENDQTAGPGPPSEDIIVAYSTIDKRLEERKLLFDPRCDSRSPAYKVFGSGGELALALLTGGVGGARLPWFSIGEELVIRDVQKDKSLNGELAKVKSYHKDKGRYDVQVLTTGLLKSLRPDNLQHPLPPPRLGTWRVVHFDRVAVRAEPALRARVLDARRPGQRIVVTRREGDWVRLHPDEGFKAPVEAWMLADGRAAGFDGLLLEQDIERWRVVSAEPAKVVDAPTPDAKTLGTREPGAIVSVAHRENEWAQLHPDEGFSSEQRQAWMLIKRVARSEGRAAALETFLEQEQCSEEKDEDPETHTRRKSVFPLAGQPPLSAEMPASDNLRKLRDELAAAKANLEFVEDMQDLECAEAFSDRVKAIEVKIEAEEAKERDAAAARQLEAEIEAASEQIRLLSAELRLVSEDKDKAAHEEDYEQATLFKRRHNELQKKIADLQLWLVQARTGPTQQVLGGGSRRDTAASDTASTAVSTNHPFEPPGLDRESMLDELLRRGEAMATSGPDPIPRQGLCGADALCRLPGSEGRPAVTSFGRLRR